MKHKIHIGGFALEMQDDSGSPMGEIFCTTPGQEKARKGELPQYSYKDAQGNPQAVVTWEQRTARFAVTNPGRSQLYAEAWMDLPGDALGNFKAMHHKVYNLSISQGSSLPLPVILAFGVAVMNIPSF